MEVPCTCELCQDAYPEQRSESQPAGCFAMVAAEQLHSCSSGCKCRSCRLLICTEAARYHQQKTQGHFYLCLPPGNASANLRCWHFSHMLCSCYFSFILTSLVYLLQFYNLQLTNAWLSKQFTKQTSKWVSKTQFPNLHSASVRTRCSLYGRDIQSFQGSWCRCDHRSFRRNTHLYLNSQKKH